MNVFTVALSAEIEFPSPPLTVSSLKSHAPEHAPQSTTIPWAELSTEIDVSLPVKLISLIGAPVPGVPESSAQCPHNQIRKDTQCTTTMRTLWVCLRNEHAELRGPRNGVANGRM